MSEIDVRQVVQGFLQTQSTLALATTREDGQPESAPLFYVNDDLLNLYWLSSPSSRHSLNLGLRPAVSATIYAPVWNWADIVGVQIEGLASAITDDRIREEILNLYLRKFQLPSELDKAITASTLYMLTPIWIRWVDNSVQFGYKTELNL
jgi:uncharacterized protein YhbP (UPF0306 family)